MKKMKKGIICLHYRSNEWDFGAQRSYFSTTKFTKRNTTFLRFMSFDQYYDYSKHSLYPGQKVWFVVRDIRTGKYSVDFDFISEMFGFGEIGSGALFEYWLNSYGSNGIAAGDLFPTKLQALNYMKYHSIFMHRTDNVVGITKNGLKNYKIKFKYKMPV